MHNIQSVWSCTVLVRFHQGWLASRFFPRSSPNQPTSSRPISSFVLPLLCTKVHLTQSHLPSHPNFTLSCRLTSPPETSSPYHLHYHHKPSIYIPLESVTQHTHVSFNLTEQHHAHVFSRFFFFCLRHSSYSAHLYLHHYHTPSISLTPL